eukprot:3387142-Pyramimonas_sp.AAC.1
MIDRERTKGGIKAPTFAPPTSRYSFSTSRVLSPAPQYFIRDMESMYVRRTCTGIEDRICRIVRRKFTRPAPLPSVSSPLAWQAWCARQRQNVSLSRSPFSQAWRTSLQLPANQQHANSILKEPFRVAPNT